MKKLFEEFCVEYNIDYDFTALGYGYASEETTKAYIIFKYSEKYKDEG